MHILLLLSLLGFFFAIVVRIFKLLTDLSCNITIFSHRITEDRIAKLWISGLTDQYNVRSSDGIQLRVHARLELSPHANKSGCKIDGERQLH